MKVLICGGGGMLGHRLWLAFRPQFETYVTLRRTIADYAAWGWFEPGRTLEHCDAARFDTLRFYALELRPNVVINAVGLVKQRPEARSPIAAIETNALFPHRLAELCNELGARLIHISTDCVFSGRSRFGRWGNYRESDEPDPIDLYGRTKLLGEPLDPHAPGAFAEMQVNASAGAAEANVLVLRTSLVGHELLTRQGLVEWFLKQTGRVRGFARARFNGLTTNELADLLVRLAVDFPDLHGLYHVASEPISKLDFLLRLREAYRVNLEIEPDETVMVDRTLCGERFRAATGYVAPDWEAMIRRMQRERPYRPGEGPTGHAAKG